MSNLSTAAGANTSAVRRYVTLGLMIALTAGFPNSGSAKKPSPCAPSIRECPLRGCSSSTSAFAVYDPLLNEQKNRSDGPAATNAEVYSAADFMDESKFPVHRLKNHPNAPDPRGPWIDSSIGKQFSELESRQVTIDGFIARALPESAESCNCDISAGDVVDTHVNVVDRPENDTDPDPKVLVAHSVIAEVTWRVRGDHPEWTTENLEQLSITHDGLKVRITGDLTYDNLHWDMVSKGYRGTLWEIHPIKRIQVLLDGHWADYSPRLNSTIKTLLLHSASPLVERWQPKWSNAQLQQFNSLFGMDQS